MQRLAFDIPSLQPAFASAGSSKIISLDNYFFSMTSLYISIHLYTPPYTPITTYNNNRYLCMS
jgi:hypothetical protein